MTYEVIGEPRLKTEDCDEWEAVMVIDLIREDGVIGDVWIAAGVPDYHRGTALAARTNRGCESIWVFGDSLDMWCPHQFQDDPAGIESDIENACRKVALDAWHAWESAVPEYTYSVEESGPLHLTP